MISESFPPTTLTMPIIPAPLPIAPTDGRYQVGELEGYESDDPTFDDLDLAKLEAIDQSAKTDPLDFYLRAWGIWDLDQDSLLIAIAYAGSLYESVKPVNRKG